MSIFSSECTQTNVWILAKDRRLYEISLAINFKHKEFEEHLETNVSNSQHSSCASRKVKSTSSVEFPPNWGQLLARSWREKHPQMKSDTMQAEAFMG
jgi:hypothetical protein